MDSEKRTYNLIEKTYGPHYGKVWRSEEMTNAEAAAINAKIRVMQWEPAAKPEKGKQ